MKNTWKVTLTFIFALFLFFTITPVDAQYNGCWPDSAKSTTFINCPDGGWIIRCRCGGGYCNPASQEFCDNPEQ